MTHNLKVDYKPSISQVYGHETSITKAPQYASGYQSFNYRRMARKLFVGSSVGDVLLIHLVNFLAIPYQQGF